MSGSCGTGGWSGPLPGDPGNVFGLSAVAVFGGIDLTWSMPTENPYAVAYTSVYRATSANFATALKIVDSGSSRYHDRTTVESPVQEYFYWVRQVSKNGTLGTLVGPASATARPTVQDTLELLTDQIDNSHLAQALKTEIARIQLVDTALASETQNRLMTNTALQEALEAVSDDLGAATTLIGEETINRVAQNEAVVGTLSILAAGVADNAAAIVNESQVRVDNESATATSLETLYAKLASGGNLVQNSSFEFDRNSDGVPDQWNVAQTGTITAGVRGLVENSAIHGEHVLRVGWTSAAVDSLLGVYQRLPVPSKATHMVASAHFAGTDGATAHIHFNFFGAGNVLLNQFGVTAPLTGSTEWVRPHTKVATPVGATHCEVGVLLAGLTGAAELLVDGVQVQSQELTEYAPSSDYAVLQTEATAWVSETGALSERVETAELVLNGNVVLGTQGLTAFVDEIDGKVTDIGAKWTVQVDVNGLAGGFGIYNTGETIDAGFDVDTFWVGKTVNKVKPFIVTGEEVFIKKAVIGTVTADMIDTSGMIIRDAGGSPIFTGGSSTLNLPGTVTGAPSAWLNSNLSLGANLLYNGDFSLGHTVGWSAVAPSLVGLAPLYLNGVNQAPIADWNINGGVGDSTDNWGMYQFGRDGRADAYHETQSNKVAVTPGARIIASVYAGSIGCDARMFLYCFNAAGVSTGDMGSASATGLLAQAEGVQGGNSLSSFKRLSVAGVPPAGTTSVVVALRKYDSTAAFAESWAFWVRGMVEEVGGTATTPGPWSAAGNQGISTRRKLTAAQASVWMENAAINAAQIGELTAANIKVQALTDSVRNGNTDTGRIEITQNKFTVFDGSNIPRVKIGFLG